MRLCRDRGCDRALKPRKNGCRVGSFLVARRRHFFGAFCELGLDWRNHWSPTTCTFPRHSWWWKLFWEFLILLYWRLGLTGWLPRTRTGVSGRCCPFGPRWARGAVLLKTPSVRDVAGRVQPRMFFHWGRVCCGVPTRLGSLRDWTWLLDVGERIYIILLDWRDIMVTGHTVQIILVNGGVRGGYIHIVLSDAVVGRP